MPAPAFNEHLGLQERFELFAGEKLIPQFAVERFHVSVFPRTAWLDEQRLDADTLEPPTNFRGGKLRSVVAAKVGRHTATNEQLAESF
jgi:hypothetical protein